MSVFANSNIAAIIFCKYQSPSFLEELLSLNKNCSCLRNRKELKTNKIILEVTIFLQLKISNHNIRPKGILFIPAQ